MTTWISTPSIPLSHMQQSLKTHPDPLLTGHLAPYPAQPRPGERCNLRNACLGSALVPQIWLGN